MYHKLMYTKIGVLDLYCQNMKKNTNRINNNIDYTFDINSDSPLIYLPWFSLIINGRSPKQPIAKASKTVP